MLMLLEYSELQMSAWRAVHECAEIDYTFMDRSSPSI